MLAGIGTIVREPTLRTLVRVSMRPRPSSPARSTCSSSSPPSKLLDLDDAGVGLLYAAVGVGGLIGGFVALVLAPGGRLARDFALGLALFGLPLALIGGVPIAVIAVIALAIIGIGNSIVDVNALTIMQRAVPDDVLGRALGALEGLLLATLGLGAVLAPVLVDLVGPEAALIVTGAVLPDPRAAQPSAPQGARRTDGRPGSHGAPRRVPMLAGLPESVLERLAREAVSVASPRARSSCARAMSATVLRRRARRGGDPRPPLRPRRGLRRDRASPRRATDGDRDRGHRRLARGARARAVRRRGDRSRTERGDGGRRRRGARLGSLSAGNDPREHRLAPRPRAPTWRPRRRRARRPPPLLLLHPLQRRERGGPRAPASRRRRRRPPTSRSPAGRPMGEARP